MKRIWAVTSGQYSDFHVVVLCQTKKQAEETLQLLKNEVTDDDYDDYNAEVEPYYLLRLGEKPKKKTSYVVEVWDIFKHKTVPDLNKFTKEKHEHVFGDHFYGSPTSRPKVYEWHNAQGYHIRAVCTDKQAAVKAVKDRMASMLANPDAYPPFEREHRIIGNSPSEVAF
jgi:hypothetical protein